ncbi:MAG: Na/Pi cotransporter family protein [Thermodesulfobacteriota bacterium]
MSTGSVAIATLGGLGLFLLGMRMMTEGLQMTAGQRIRSILKTLSANRLVGCCTGAVVTAIIQSSSATTVMLVGFVGAGLMTLYQAVGVILGANIGTTLTAQLIAFKLSSLSLPAIALGVGLKFFSTKKRLRYIGEIILGFGLLFFGLTVMKDSLAPLKDDPMFIEFFTKFDPTTIAGLLLCVGVGAVLTVLVQSSSATIGLTMSLAWQGLIDFPTAMALVLGENIGTTLTAQISTIGSRNADAHQVANAHTLFNVLGVGLMILIFPWFVDGVERASELMGAGPLDALVEGEKANISRYIANGHTIFNVTNALFFLAIMPALVRTARLFTKRDPQEDDLFRLPEFSSRFQDTPIAAVAEVRQEVHAVSRVVRAGLDNALEGVWQSDPKKINRWQRYEEHINTAHRHILSHLSGIFQNEVSEDLSREVSVLMRISYNLERIGNGVANIAKHFEEVMEQDLPLSSEAWKEVDHMAEKVRALLDLVSDSIVTPSEDLLTKARELEQQIDTMRAEMRQNHIERIKEERCQVDAGIAFMDILTRFEKIGDWTYNIAKGLAEIENNTTSINVAATAQGLQTAP